MTMKLGLVSLALKTFADEISNAETMRNVICFICMKFHRQPNETRERKTRRRNFLFSRSLDIKSTRYFFLPDLSRHAPSGNTFARAAHASHCADISLARFLFFAARSCIS